VEDHIDDFNKVGHAFFDNMQIGLKIMPSYNNENNLIYMERISDYQRTMIKNALSLMAAYNMNYTYFFVNNTADTFPALHYKEENIPVGSSISMCISLMWADASKGRHFDLMKEIKNFPQCIQSKTSGLVWNEKDTKFGMDVPVWIQHEFDIDCSNENDCKYYCEKNYDAEFVSGKRGKKCFSYEVLAGICLAIQYNAVTDDCSYAGGCFPGGKNHLLEPAKIGKVYKFDDIDVEIRSKNDPVIFAGLASDYSYNFGSGIYYLAAFMKILFAAALIGAIALGALIFLEKNKKPSNVLIEEKEERKEAPKNDSSVGVKNTENVPEPDSGRKINL